MKDLDSMEVNKMAEIKQICINAKDKLKTHKVEIIVEFTEPVTQREAEEVVSKAVASYIFEYETGGK